MAEVVLTEKELAEYKAMFDKYDKSGNGLLDMEEVVLMLREMGYRGMTREAIKRRFKLYDRDGDKTLSFQEFHEEYLNTRHRAQFEEATIRHMFSEANTDGTGRISPDQLITEHLSNLRMSDDFLSKTLATAKESGDGKIDADEFYAAYLEDLESSS